MNTENFLKDTMSDIEKYLILNNTKYLIGDGCEWFRETITLYAKQHNLLESALLLLDNEMNEEAFILARSAINNYFLIGYLINDDDNRTHLKEYNSQPLLSERFFLKNVETMLKGSFGKRMKERGLTVEYSINDLQNKLNEVEKQIINQGFDKNKKPLSIRKLAEKSDCHGFDLYSTYYSDASKFEHSDILSLNIYKQPVDSKTSTNKSFIMNLNKTDVSLKERIYTIFEIVYLDSFHKIVDSILKNEPHLLKKYYDMNKLGFLLNNIQNHLNNKL